MTQYGAATLENLDGGQFLKKNEQAFQEMIKQMREYVEQHGKTASATLTMKVKVDYKAMDQGGAWLILAVHPEVTMPKTPGRAISAMPHDDQAGNETLWHNLHDNLDQQGDVPGQTVLMDKSTGEIIDPGDSNVEGDVDDQHEDTMD